MVDFDQVFTRVKRGAFVGAGAFGATFVDDYLFSDWDETNTAIGQVAVGLGVSVGADYVGEEVGTDNITEIATEVGEYGGYGVQGAGWSSLANQIDTETSSRARTRQVSVNNRSSSRSRTKSRSTSSNSGGSNTSSSKRSTSVSSGSGAKQETEDFQLSQV